MLAAGVAGSILAQIDLMEANNRGFSSNLHTQRGEGHDGECNSWGCLSVLGL